MSTAFEPTPLPPTCRRAGRFDWIGAHGVLQAVLIVLAALVVLVSLGGCAGRPRPACTETATEAELRALQARIDALDARLARDEYALLAVDRHTLGAAVGAPAAPTADPVRARLIENARTRVAGATIP